METFAADGGVQPHSQPHSGSGKPADWKSNAHDQFLADESPDPDGHVRQDSHTANQPNVLSSSANNSAKITHTKGQFVPWRVDQLQPHPSYARLSIKVPASRLNALLEMGEDAFLFPLIVTSKGIVIDGYARLEVARLRGRATVECIEYNISEEEALRRLLLCHRPSPGLPPFTRIAMARGLAKSFKEKALHHQQAGGKSKGSSKLPQAEKVDVRKEIAAAAGVSVGTLSHALEVLKTGDPEILRALCNGEIKIDRVISSPVATPLQCIGVKPHIFDGLLQSVIRTFTLSYIAQGKGCLEPIAEFPMKGEEVEKIIRETYDFLSPKPCDASNDATRLAAKQLLNGLRISRGLFK